MLFLRKVFVFGVTLWNSSLHTRPDKSQKLNASHHHERCPDTCFIHIFFFPDQLSFTCWYRGMLYPRLIHMKRLLYLCPERAKFSNLTCALIRLGPALRLDNRDAKTCESERSLNFLRVDRAADKMRRFLSSAALSVVMCPAGRFTSTWLFTEFKVTTFPNTGRKLMLFELG